MATIEIFSADCPTCQTTAAMVREVACPDCTIEVVPVTTAAGHARAIARDVQRVPAVAVDGRLGYCCNSGTPSRRDIAAMIRP